VAERIPGLDLSTRLRSGNRAEYPWWEWANGDCWRLEPGVDFTVSVEHFRRLCHTHAQRNGLRAVTELDGPTALLVQFVKRAEPEQPD